MPALLSKAFTPALRHFERHGFTIVRMSSMVGTAVPAPKQTIADTSEGFLRWQRDVSRNPNAEQTKRIKDTPLVFLTRRIGHAFEIYPLFAIVGFWVVILGYSIYAASNKLEVWFDKTREEAPHDWSRAKDNYYKLHTVIFDPKNVTHQRLPIMEQLQDEMLEAAKKRGTRSTSY